MSETRGNKPSLDIHIYDDFIHIGQAGVRLDSASKISLYRGNSPEALSLINENSWRMQAADLLQLPVEGESGIFALSDRLDQLFRNFSDLNSLTPDEKDMAVFSQGPENGFVHILHKIKIATALRPELTGNVLIYAQAFRTVEQRMRVVMGWHSPQPKEAFTGKELIFIETAPVNPDWVELWQLALSHARSLNEYERSALLAVFEMKPEHLLKPRVAQFLKP